MGMYNTITDHCKLTKDRDLQYYVVDGMDVVKKEMLRLLNVIDEICVEYKLKYWIDGGTLIGAVRHGGFIPWDDDIDISMLKPDYLILIRELENRTSLVNAKEYLWYSGNNKNQHCCNYLCSKMNLYGRPKGTFGFVPIKLDIRPINIIENSEESIRLNKELREIANEWIFGKSYIPLSNISDNYRKLSKNDFFKFYNEEYGIKEYSEGLLALPYYEFATDTLYPKDSFKEVIRKSFENQMTFILQNYDSYLKALYGNYMELPPLENRVPAQYEYISFDLPFKMIINILQNPSRYKTIRLFNSLKLYGIKNFIRIIKEIVIH